MNITGVKILEVRTKSSKLATLKMLDVLPAATNQTGIVTYQSHSIFNSWLMISAVFMKS